MKKIALLVFGTFCCTVLFAQAGIYMKINNLNSGATGVHQGEFLLLNYQQTDSIAGNFSGGGAGAGKVIHGDILVSKSFEAQSNVLFQALITTGRHVPSVEFRWYNNSDELYYTTTIQDVFLTGFSVISPQENCTDPTHTVDKMRFHFQSINFNAPPLKFQ